MINFIPIKAGYFLINNENAKPNVRRKIEINTSGKLTNASGFVAGTPNVFNKSLFICTRNMAST